MKALTPKQRVKAELDRRLAAACEPEAEGEAVAPVMWQWRSRLKGGAWDAWERGRFNQEVPPFAEVEERALYTRPIADLRAKLDRAGGAFKLGDRVTKTKGSRWTGRVVGTYSTALTPEGYAVESETETGSVQIYPAAALSLAGEEKTGASDV